MPILYLIILALVQGVTEFLPVSSSGHLVLVHWLFQGDMTGGNYAQNHLMDIAVHIGTLFAVILYFRKDIGHLFFGLIDLLKGHITDHGRLLLVLAAASVPVVIAGLVLHLYPILFLSSLHVLAWANILYALLLYASDKMPERTSNADPGFKNAMIIGAAQILALVPGTSRSGITMTAARFLGFSRIDAARFSMLLGMVAIAGAGLLGSFDLMDDTALPDGFAISALIAALMSFISALAAVALLMRWLKNATFLPFVLYRLALGTVLLIVLYI